MTTITDKLAAALRTIRDARDHCAETGAYPKGVAEEDQQFDDWAADIASDALAEYGAQRARQPERFRVTWEINSDAATPLEAAREAWSHMRRHDSIACYFTVHDKQGNVTAVDLQDTATQES